MGPAISMLNFIFLVGFFREASGDPGWVFLGRGTGGGMA